MTKTEAKHWYLQLTPGLLGSGHRLGERLRHLGAVSAGPSAYLVPREVVGTSALLRIIAQVRRMGGRASLLPMVPPGIRPIPTAPRPHLPAPAPPPGTVTATADTPGDALRKIRSLMARAAGAVGRDRNAVQKVEGKVWVTAAGVSSEASGCAWLIWRFIDHRAVFKFVSPEGYRTEAGELSFAMPAADFDGSGHGGPFEALAGAFNLRSRAFDAMGRLLARPFNRESPAPHSETWDPRRLKALIVGITMTEDRDLRRLQRSFPLLDRLYLTLQSGLVLPGPAPAPKAPPAAQNL